MTAFIFIHHRRVESIDKTISNFLELSESDSTFLLVDNSEDDLIRAQITELIQEREWPVTLLNIQNRGYGDAANSGLAYIRSNFPSTRYAIIVTHDVRYISGEISTLTDALDNDSQMVAIGPRVINSNFFRSKVPLIWSDGGKLTKILKRPKHKKFGRRIDSFTEIQYVTWLEGCFITIDLAKLGNLQFDPKYFMYLEDVDFCMQAARKGLKIGHTPQFCVSQETFGVPPKLFTENFAYFINKFFPRRKLIVKLYLILLELRFHL